MFHTIIYLNAMCDMLCSRLARPVQARLLCIQRLALLSVWVISHANIYLLVKRNKQIKERRSWRYLKWMPVELQLQWVQGIRVLSGFKRHPGGNPGRLQLSRREASAQRNSGPDKCSKCWQNVICWHLPTEDPRCFKHDRLAFTKFLASSKEEGGVMKYCLQERAQAVLPQTCS